MLSDQLGVSHPSLVVLPALRSELTQQATTGYNFTPKMLEKPHHDSSSTSTQIHPKTEIYSFPSRAQPAPS